jgi:signal transduction histidine kinase
MFNQAQDIFQESEDSHDLLIQIWMRFVFACASLLVFFVDPTESGLPSQFTHMLLISYCLYSACFVFVYDMQLFSELAASRAAHWIDTLFFGCLIALTGGSDSIFFFFFFFPILVASFSWGFREGLKVTIASVVLFTIAGLSVISSKNPYDLGEAILHPISFIVFGYMIAHWGRGRIVLKRRLELIQEISTHWNPRFGVNHAITINLGRLVEFYRGSRCMLVLNRANLVPKQIMYVRERGESDNSEIPRKITEHTAKELLSLPDSLAIAYENPAARSLHSFNKYVAYDINTQESTNRYLQECAALSSLFDDESFISVPYRQQGVTSGRIFLVAGNSAFNRADVAFTQQVANALATVVENMQLIENLVSEASGQERHRISLDVHDTTIQPYIALTLALDGLSREYKTNNPLTEKIGEIINMANMTIQDLRSYKDNLREKSLMRGDVLFSSIKNQADRLERFYGIHVDVIGTVDPNLAGHLAEAAFQIMKEGLSNILRHTNAKNAFVSLQSNDTHLLLEIANETHAPKNLKVFIPKSISERVLSLNGETLVETEVEGYTVIRVTIPLTRE